MRSPCFSFVKPFLRWPNELVRLWKTMDKHSVERGKFWSCISSKRASTNMNKQTFGLSIYRTQDSLLASQSKLSKHNECIAGSNQTCLLIHHRAWDQHGEVPGSWSSWGQGRHFWRNWSAQFLFFFFYKSLTGMTALMSYSSSNQYSEVLFATAD